MEFQTPDPDLSSRISADQDFKKYIKIFCIIHTNEKSMGQTEMSWWPGHVVGWGGTGKGSAGVFVYTPPCVCPMGRVLLVDVLRKYILPGGLQ